MDEKDYISQARIRDTFTGKDDWIKPIEWKCLDCEFEGIGAAVSYHAIYNMTHRLVEKNKDGNNS